LILSIMIFGFGAVCGREMYVKEICEVYP
jgi:hypothetical protein